MNHRWYWFLLVLAWVPLAVSEPESCLRDLRAEAWLSSQKAAWERRLAQRPGYEPPGVLVVCREKGGGPRVASGRIHLPPLRDGEEQLSLAHEYLHWAFRHHPVARDERFIEGLARVLVLGEEER